MKDSHLVIALLIFIGLISYAVNAMRKIDKLELQKSAALNSVDDLKLQKTNLEVENQNLENILNHYQIRR
jgi:hypothetical protein